MSSPYSALAAKVRSKYPGAYDSLSDDDLGKKIIEKYPEYQSLVQPIPGDVPGKQTVAPLPKSMAPTPFWGREIPANIAEAAKAQGDRAIKLGDAQQRARTSPTPFTSTALTIMPFSAAPEVIPSAKHAGLKFEEVLEAAKNASIKPGGPVAEAMRGKELASRGGTLPKVLRDFVKRTSDPEAAPISYQEARDFYVNSRLAMSEYLQTKPNMWRQVTVFKKALDEAIGEAAGSVGKGGVYREAMTEYARAAKVKKLVEAAAKIGIPLAIGYKLNKALGALSKVGE